MLHWIILIVLYIASSIGTYFGIKVSIGFDGKSEWCGEGASIIFLIFVPFINFLFCIGVWIHILNKKTQDRNFLDTFFHLK